MVKISPVVLYYLYFTALNCTIEGALKDAATLYEDEISSYT